MRGVRCPGLLVVCILLSLSGAGTQKAESKNCAKWCPINSKCVSNRSCVCKPGFSSEKELITNPAESCEDINECLLPGFSCGDFAMCKNSEGSYTCVCNLGYKLLSGAESFVNESENTCQDVDECSSGQHQCHNSTVCKNTVGSYKCHCRPGWKPTSGSLRGPDTICQEPPFPTWTLLPTAHSQTLLRFSVEVQNLLRDFNPATVNYTIQKLIEAVDKLLEDPMETETQQVAAQLLSNLEQSLRTLAQFLPKGPFTYTSPSNTELSLMVKEQDNKDVTTVHHGQTWMELDWAVTAGAKISENGSSVAGILTITSIAQLLVLGCTWGFGLFLFNPHSTWLSYIFTLLNCLQGLFLYVMLCLLNKKVREEYWKWACMVTGSKYTEFNSSTTGTGTSQTRALRSSESGM